MTKLSNKTLSDLKQSGINRKAAKKMLLRDVSPEEMLDIYRIACQAINIQPPKTLNGAYGYEIPYLGLDGKPTGFARYKLFGEYIPKGEKRIIKYLQLPGTKPKFYFPPFCDWQKIANDTSVSIYFVEGEKKATALCLSGLPAIGLGGVWSWRTRSDDDTSDPIADFNLLDLSSRKTIIAFDADV